MKPWKWDCFISSSQPYIEEQHDHEADRETECRPVLMAGTVGFGNDFVADDVEHRPGGEGEAPWQQRLRKTDNARAEKSTDRLDETGQSGDAPGAKPGIALAEQRNRHCQTFGRILEADADRKRQPARQTVSPEPQRRRQALRENCGS